eukprot:658578-Pleurochrysis_carterae.AAC.1
MLTTAGLQTLDVSMWTTTFAYFASLRFKLTMQDKPKQFLDMNIDLGNDGSVKVSPAAYVKAKAEFYLPKLLAEYPRIEAPSTPQLVKDYEIAARKEH